MVVNQVVDEISRFVKQPHIRECLRKGDLNEVYNEISTLDPKNGYNFNTGDFTKFLIEKCDIPEPLRFCNNEMPVGYLYGHYHIQEYTIPPFITHIGLSAFSFCQNLRKVKIPKSIKYIGLQAFHACPNLTILEYDGTTDDWSKIDKNWDWKDLGSGFVLRCLDEDVNV